jgi:hypothetical protein
MARTQYETAPTSTFMVASTLERVEVGQEFDSYPPHVTIFPPFTMRTAYFDIFNQDLQEIVEQNPMAMPQGGSAVLFGDDESIPARRFDRATRNFNVIGHFHVHASVYRSVNELGGIYDPQYVGLHYAPHSTDSLERSVAEGEVVRLDNLTVFEKDAQKRKKLVRAVHLWEKIDG